MLMSRRENIGMPAQEALNMRIMAAAPMRPTTDGRIQLITLSKIVLPWNFT